MINDVTAGGALMGKEHDKIYELLEEMASNKLPVAIGSSDAKEGSWGT